MINGLFHDDYRDNEWIFNDGIIGIQTSGARSSIGSEWYIGITNGQ